jgi:hypothetical protein
VSDPVDVAMVSSGGRPVANQVNKWAGAVKWCTARRHGPERSASPWSRIADMIGRPLARVKGAPVYPVTFLIVPSRGLLGRLARYDLLPLSHG